jgi:glutaredoxin
MEVIIFTTNSCPKCIEIKSLLQKKGIEYKEFNVEEPDGLAELAMLGIGVQSVPVLVWNGETFTDIKEIKQKIIEGRE